MIAYPDMAHDLPRRAEIVGEIRRNADRTTTSHSTRT